ncbi:hypothetical protein HELRODRAFT_96656 [Helobdella robusta]|uniref:Interferon-related developmental regulator N-terminal domain-containing protein n=1 Tax=Helobdella robusta TaxID=6412 RepID=T1G9D2_HELRO|nr:hypothetical protein HELRODRAFT_96656 [Helobdella robusta]ESN90717.1 hypothetical protein HELRODRAFT_96656 [Helobdella robusta]
MPKHRRKDRPPSCRNNNQEHGAGGDDNDDYQDDAMSVMSVISNASDNRATDGSDECNGALTAQENYEEKMSTCIEGISQKNSKGRIESLKSLKSGLCKQYSFSYLSDRYVTVSDGLEKCLKRGCVEEQLVAADCICVLFIQIACSPAKDELLKSVSPILKVLINDNAVSLQTRCSCAEALGLCVFLAVEEPEDIYETMGLFEQHFKLSFKSMNNNNAQQQLAHPCSQLHNSCLGAWALLFTLLSDKFVLSYAQKFIILVSSMLSSESMELRITAGETIALMFEAGRDVSEDFDDCFEANKLEELCKKLKELSTECNKYRAKKDKKVQKASFRDILKAVQDGEFGSSEIKINIQESLYLESWVQKTHYDQLCRVLTSGMNAHLQENPLIRDIFSLGEPINFDQHNNQRNSKLDKVVYKAAYKERTKYRSKQRSKKSMNCYGGD